MLQIFLWITVSICYSIYNYVYDSVFNLEFRLFQFLEQCLIKLWLSVMMYNTTVLSVQVWWIVRLKQDIRTTKLRLEIWTWTTLWTQFLLHSKVSARIYMQSCLFYYAFMARYYFNSCKQDVRVFLIFLMWTRELCLYYHSMTIKFSN